MTQAQLAGAAGAHPSVVSRFERIGHIPKARSGVEWLQAMRTALEAAGVVFTNGEEPGVKLRKVP